MMPGRARPASLKAEGPSEQASVGGVDAVSDQRVAGHQVAADPHRLADQSLQVGIAEGMSPFSTQHDARLIVIVKNEA